MAISTRPIPALIFTSLLFVLAACSDSSPILIGFSGQLTGKIADVGVPARNGVQLAIENVNAAGGVNGRKLKLIAKDDGNNPVQAIRVDQELIDAGVIAVIGHLTSSQTMAALPLFNKNEVVLLSPTTSTPALTGKKDYFFRIILDNSHQSRELAHYAWSALDVNTVIILADTDNSGYSTPFMDTFQKVFEENGGKILAKVLFSSKKTNGWENVSQKLMQLKPQALLVICSAYDAVAIAQRVRASKLNTKIISGGWAYTDYILYWGRQDVEGMHFVSDYTTDNPKSEFVKFRESYKNRFGNTPNFSSSFGYEATMTLVQALKKTDGSPDGLTEALASSGPYTGLTSNYRLDEYGDVQRDLFIVTILDGEFRTVEMR